MAVIVATRANYWISSTALSITLNALGEPNRIQAGVASGAVIMCYIRGVDGLDFDNGHDYRRWPLTISPTYFNSNTEKYLYVAIPRSNAIGSEAMVVFPSQKLDIYGYEVVEDSETHEQTQGEQIGTDDYYYIWLQGIITSSGEGGYTPRAWRDDAQPDYGILRTDEATDSTETNWYRWNHITQTVTFLKDIWMDATSVFKNLRLTKMIFNGHELNGVAIKNVTPSDSDDTIVTPAYLDGFTDGKYLRKDRDDRTEFSLGIGGELTVGGATYANGGVKTDEVRSTNYSGDTIADTGFLLSNNILGRSKLIIDEIYVRVKAVFEALEVKKWSVVAGDEIRSCAANTIALVDYLGPDGQRKGYSYMKIPWLLKGMPFLRKVASWLNYPNFYSKKKWIRMTLTEDELRDVVYCRCYFLAKDGEKEIENWWKGSTDGGYEYGHDLARCQTMNLENIERKTYLPSVVPQSKTGNVFWWRKVMNVSTSPVTIDDKEYHYFDVYFDFYTEKSARERGEQVSWCASGSDIPVAGDDVVQFGNDSNPGRMNLIMTQVNGGGRFDYDTSDAPCTKYYRGIYTFNLTKCWWGGNPCKCKLSPATGYEFYGPDFKFIREYGEKKVEMQRGKWTDIPNTKDDYERAEYPDYSDDIKDETTGDFISRADDKENNCVRKCYYYDAVTHQGCTWLCTVRDDSHWVAPDTWGVPCFDEQGNYLDNGHAISDADYALLSYDKKTQCGRLPNYTNTEPGTEGGRADWIKLVDRGTSVKTVEIRYAKDIQGTIPPQSGWVPTIAELSLQDGDYLWTRTRTTYSDTLAETYSYSVSRWGIDGDGIYSINSYFLGRSDAGSINASNDNPNDPTYPIWMPTDQGYAQANAQHKWFDTFDAMVAANGGAGAIQGWYVWTKTLIKYDQPVGQSTHKPDVVSYQFNRIGVDGQIGMEEYYMLAASDDFNTVFGSATPAKNDIGIVWYNQQNPASERYRLAQSTQQQSNINTTNAVGFLSTTPFWTLVRPTYDKNTHGNKIYLWNFEYSVDGKGTSYATRPICIGNHARGIIGVQELYACSAFGVPQEGRLYPNDINNSGVTTDIQAWGDEIYDRAPTEALPYQWNKTVTIYIDSYGTKNGQTKKASDWTDRQGVVWDESSCDVYHHVSAVRGTNGEDGAGEESIFILTNTVGANNSYTGTLPKDINRGKVHGQGEWIDKPNQYSVDDYVPEGWSDNPQGISQSSPYEFVSTRKLGAADAQGRKLWGDFSTPVLRSNWGKNGVDGDGTEYVFMRTKNLVAPTFGFDDGDATATEYKSQEWLPYINNKGTGAGYADAESNRCTDNPKGTDSTYKYEWVAKRTMGDAAASGANQGRREWLSYYTCTQQGEGASETHKMSLWSNLAESITKVRETYKYGVNESSATPPSEDGNESQAAVLNRWYTTRDKVASLWTVNRWLWVKTDIEWSDGSHTTLYTNERNPNDGVAGQDIVVDGATVVTYCMTDNNTQQPSDSLFKSYAEAMADLSDTKRWLWSRALTYYKKANSAADSHDAGSSSNYNVSYIPKNGTNGTSPYFADIDNEMDSVACNAQGNTLSAYDQHIGVHVWHGSAEQDITTLTTNSITGITITPDATNKRIRVQVAAGTNIATVNTITITIASSGSGNMTLRFTLNGVRPGADGKNAVLYNLLPSVDEVSVGRTASGGYNPRYNTLKCGYRKNDGGTNTTVADATGTIDSKNRIFFRRRGRGGPYESVYYYYNDATYKRMLVVTSGYNNSGLDAQSYDQVEFIIYPDTTHSSLDSITESSVVDRETVPVLSDGVDGAAGAEGRAVTSITEYYKATNSSDPMSTPTSDTGWSTDPNLSDLTDKWDENHKYLWNYEKVTYSKGTTVERTTPQILAIWTKDGASIDSIVNYYKVTNSSTAPSKNDSGWDDDPIAPGQGEYLWNYEIVYDTDSNVVGETDVQLIGYCGTNGVNGQNAVRIDLDNENDSISYDGAGNKLSANVTSTAYMFDGATDVSDDTAWSISAREGVTAQQATIDTLTHVITVTGMNATTAKVTVQGVYTDADNITHTRTAVLTLKKLVGVDKFDLDIRPNALFMNTSNGWSESKTVTVKVMRTPANGGTPTAVNPSTYGLVVDASIGTLGSYNSTTKSYTLTITQTQATNNNDTTITLYKSGDASKVYDRETIPFNKASNGTSPWVADLDNEMDSVSCDDTGHPVSEQIVSTNIKLFQGSTGKNFKIASITRNGNSSMDTGVTVSPTASQTSLTTPTEFSVTYATTAQISGKDDFAITIQAVDNSNVVQTLHFTVNGVIGDVYNLLPSVNEIHAMRSGGTYVVGNSKYYNLFCGYSKSVNGSITEVAEAPDNSQSDSRLIDSKYNIYFHRHKRNGDWDKTDGGDYQYWRYTHTTNKTSISSLDIDTYDAVEFILSTDQHSYLTRELYNIIDRETVYVLADGIDVAQLVLSQSVFAYAADRTGKAVGEYIYLSAKMVVNGVETVLGNELQFTKQSGYITISYLSAASAYQIAVDQGRSPNETVKVKCTKTIGGVTYTAYANLAVYPNKQGDVGGTGRMFYLAGIWDSEKTYTRNDSICPIVEWNDNYWYLDANSSHNNEPSGSSTYWNVAPNFAIVLTEALFAEFAKLGSFVVAGDFFFSQFGTLYTANNTGVTVKGKNYQTEYTIGDKTGVPYTFFDAENPQGSAQGMFAPTLVLNALTGEVYMNDAVIKGTLNGATGSFSGNLTATSTSFKELTCKADNYGRTTINDSWEEGSYDWFGIASQVKRGSNWYDTITVGTRYGSSNAYGRIAITECDSNGNNTYAQEIEPSAVKIYRLGISTTNPVIKLDASSYEIELRNSSGNSTIKLDGDNGKVSASKVSATRFEGADDSAVSMPFNIVTGTTVALPTNPRLGMVIFCTRCNTVTCGATSGNSICDSTGTNRGTSYDFGTTKPRVFMFKQSVWYEFCCHS